MDKDGYPQKKELDAIKNWDYQDIGGLFDFIEDIWKYSDCGYFKRGRKYIYLSTAGWSGNEDIIGALKQNTMFWPLCWVQSRHGGHYIFLKRK